jgi:hypothetical protein
MATTASADIVSVTGGSLTFMAAQGDPSADDSVSLLATATVPQTQSATAIAGSSTAYGGYEILADGIAMGTALHRDGSYVDDSVLSYAGAMGSFLFTVDEDSTYALTGTHTLGDEQRVSLQVSFMDLTDSVTLCYNYQYSENTAHELLRLGQPDGEFNMMTGSTTGAVLAGHEYALTFNYMIVNPLGADDGTSSVGSLNLAIMPEPSSMLLLALAGLGVLRRR